MNIVSEPKANIKFKIPQSTPKSVNTKVGDISSQYHPGSQPIASQLNDSLKPSFHQDGETITINKITIRKSIVPRSFSKSPVTTLPKTYQKPSVKTTNTQPITTSVTDTPAEAPVAAKPVTFKTTPAEAPIALNPVVTLKKTQAEAPVAAKSVVTFKITPSETPIAAKPAVKFKTTPAETLAASNPVVTLKKTQAEAPFAAKPVVTFKITQAQAPNDAKPVVKFKTTPAEAPVAAKPVFTLKTTSVPPKDGSTLKLTKPGTVGACKTPITNEYRELFSALLKLKDANLTARVLAVINNVPQPKTESPESLCYKCRGSLKDTKITHVDSQCQTDEVINNGIFQSAERKPKMQIIKFKDLESEKSEKKMAGVSLKNLFTNGTKRTRVDDQCQTDEGSVKGNGTPTNNISQVQIIRVEKLTSNKSYLECNRGCQTSDNDFRYLRRITGANRYSQTDAKRMRNRFPHASNQTEHSDKDIKQHIGFIQRRKYVSAFVNLFFVYENVSK